MCVPKSLQIRLDPMLSFSNDYEAHRQRVIQDLVMEIFDRSMLGMYGHRALYYLAKPIHVHPNKSNEIHLKKN